MHFLLIRLIFVMLKIKTNSFYAFCMFIKKQTKKAFLKRPINLTLLFGYNNSLGHLRALWDKNNELTVVHLIWLLTDTHKQIIHTALLDIHHIFAAFYPCKWLLNLLLCYIYQCLSVLSTVTSIPRTNSPT